MQGGANPAHCTTAGGRVRYWTRLCLEFHFRRTVSARILNSSTAEKLMLVIYIYPLVTRLSLTDLFNNRRLSILGETCPPAV